VHYKARSAPLRELVAAFESGMPLDEAVIVGSGDLTAADVARFWNEFVPMVREARGNWDRVHERAQLVQAHFGPEQLHRLERILQRFTWLLRQRTEAHFERDAQPKIVINGLFRYEMLLHEIVIDGPDMLAAVLRDPGLAAERATRTTDASQLWTLTMVRYDMVMFHARTFRWNEIGRHGHKYNIPGIFEFYPLLSAMVPPEEEFVPVITKHDDGEFTVDGLYGPSMSNDPSTA
jgi:hypothetical protein